MGKSMLSSYAQDTLASDIDAGSFICPSLEGVGKLRRLKHEPTDEDLNRIEMENL